MVKPLIVTPDMVDDGMPADLPWVNLLDVQAGVPYQGQANCQPFLQAAVNHLAALGGGRLLIPPGTYRVDTDVTIGTDIVIDGRGATIRENGGSLVVAGSISGMVNVTADIDRNDRSITVANGDEAGFDAGDLVLVASDYFCEYHVIESTALGQLNLEGRIHNLIEVAQNATIALVTSRRLDVHGLTFDGYGGNVHPRVTYGRFVRFADCTFTGNNAAEGYGHEIAKSQFVTYRDCLFRDIGPNYKGLLIEGCGFVTVQGCEFTNVQQRTLQTRWSHDVEYLDNRLWRCDAYNLSMEGCYNFVIAGNDLDNTPDTYAQFGADATSRAGIFLIGCERGTIKGNALRNTIGEGCIYIRHANETYPTAGSNMLEVRGITIVGNTIDATLTGTHSAHLAGIYAKASAKELVIADNQIRTQVTCIYIGSTCDDVIIANNQLDTRSWAIVTDVIAPATDLWTERIAIVNNHCRRTVDGDYGLISLHVPPDGQAIVAGNRLEALNQTGNKHLIMVLAGSAAPPVAWGDTRVQIHNNLLEADGSIRGIQIYNFSGVPAIPGAVRVWQNIVDVPGVQYSNVTTPVDEVESTLEIGTATPNVWGLDRKAWSTNNGGAQNVTSFVGLRTGIVFHVRGNDGGNTTFVNGANLVTKSGGNVTPANDETITFRAVSTTKVLEV